MLAYVYHKDKTLVLEQKPEPVLNLANGAVIKVLSCSICGTDVRTFRYGSEKIQDGRTIGHEVTGEIVKIADEFNDQFKIGDHVAIAPAIGCGKCVSCRRGKTNMCDSLETIGFQYDGGFAEFMGVPRQAILMSNMYKLPKSDNYAQYSLCEPLACTINAHSYLKIGAGECVLIFGSGIIGCLHAELAFLSGAASVIIAEPSEERILQSKALLPNVHFVNTNNSDLKQAVMDLSDGQGADVAIIACSVGSAQSQGMSLLAKCGRISLFGGLAGESTGFIDSNLIHYKEISVFGVHASTPEQNRQAMELLEKGDINLDKYISGKFSLNDIETALQSAADGKLIKAVIVS